MSIRGAVVAVALAALGCLGAKRENPTADSLATVAAAAEAARQGALADSARRADSIAALTAGAKTTGSKTKAGGTSTRIIGRDSVRQGPILRIPIIPDTVKRRPSTRYLRVDRSRIVIFCQILPDSPVVRPSTSFTADSTTPSLKCCTNSAAILLISERSSEQKSR